MHENAYLADAIGWSILIIPAALVSLKLGFPTIQWWMIFLATAMLSWLGTTSYVGLFPSSMGFGTGASLLFGWATMFPLLALCSFAWRIKGLRGTKGARFLTIALVILSGALPARACFRWLPEDEAKDIARGELRRRGFSEFEVRDAEKTWDGWTIYAEIPNHPRYPVYLSRSGVLSGLGG